MSKIKKVCVSMAMAVALLFGSVFSFFGVNSLKTKAMAPEYLANPTLAYYFNDAYPSLTHCAYEGEFGGNPFYEYCKVNSGSFDEMANGEGDFEYSYFGNIAYDAVVIIDIKTFLPDDGTLYFLFSNLKAKNCTTVFISVYSSDEFTEDTMSYIDYFYQSDYSEMQAFISRMLRHLKEWSNPLEPEYGTIHDVCIFIDGSWVDMETYSASVQDFCESSFYMNYFIEELRLYVNSSNPEATIDDILLENNIHLLVHTESNEAGEASFIDIVTWTEYNNIKEIDEIYNNEVNPITATYTAFIGFRAMDALLDSMLEAKQDEIGISRVLVYTYEKSHVNLDGDGLVIITEQDLKNMYEEEDDEPTEAEIITNGLAGVIVG